MMMGIIYFTSYASANSELFTVDEQEIYCEFTKLNKLESFLLDNPDVTINSLNNDYRNEGLNDLNVLSVLGSVMEPPLGIPSFVWGCCLGVPGVAIVYFVSEDKDETMKALWGCIAMTAISTIGYIIYYVAILSIY